MGHAVPEGSAAWAVGDVHGRADLLESMLRRIEADAASVAAARKVAVFLGDYVDRGADSRGVIERLCSWDPAGIERVFLRGNHEIMALDAMSDPDDAPATALWEANGGLRTMESYGAGSVAELARLMPERHARFLRSLRATHREGGYLFVHAGIRPGVPLEDQDPEDLAWIREPFLASDEDHGFCVVHGHTVADAPCDRGNRIGIDTGAYRTGVLTAVALEGEGRRFLQA